MTEKRILLVEDDAADAALMLRTLEDCSPPSRAMVVRNGEDAFEYLLNNDENGKRRPPPDLILLDWNLPGLGGAEVLERLRSEPRTRWLPVVVISGGASRAGHSDAYRLGANSFVVKSVDAEQFEETLELIVRYWLGVNQPAPWVN